ncbi:MAG: hypothetical protein ABJC12_06260, partial [Saprospiraceae bacterium]
PVSKFNLKSEKKATPGKTASLKTKSAKIAYHKDRKNEVLPAKVNSIPSTNKIFATAPLANESNDIIIPNHSPSVISNAVSVVILPDDAVIDQATMQPVVQKVRLPAQLESIFFSEIINENGQNENIVTHVSSHFHGLNFFVETGASFIPGLVNEYEQGWNFNAGGGIGYKLGTKTSLIVSGGYLLQNKGFEFERTSAVIQKDFGIRSNFNSLHPDKLHFIYSQIGIQYQLKRNLFSLFGGMQWLYGAQGNIFIRSTDQFGNNVETNDYTWLSTNGMRHLLWNGEVSYGYRITPRISINGGIKYYFSSIDKEDVTLSQEGYYWKGRYSSFTPSINLNYHLYGKR